MQGVRKRVAAGALAAAMVVGGAGQASALTWQDVADFLRDAMGSGRETTAPASPSPSPSGAPGATGAAVGRGEVAKMLSELRDAKQGQGPDSAELEANEPYNREEQYIGSWPSVQSTGFAWEGVNLPSTSKCNSREAAMIRDGQGVQADAECRPTAGVWKDPYGGPDITADKVSRGLDTDHIVALKNAHNSGAYRMDAETRKKIATDPLNLISSGASANRSKGDQAADTWLPPESSGFRCEYVSRQIQVKKKYDLSVSGTERAALEREVAACDL